MATAASLAMALFIGKDNGARVLAVALAGCQNLGLLTKYHGYHFKIPSTPKTRKRKTKRKRKR